MSFKSAWIGRVYLVHFVASPRREDIIRSAQDVTETRRRAGHPLVALGLISKEASHPDGPARLEAFRQHRVWYDNCESLHLVIEAEGFAATLVRALIAEIALVAQRRALTVYTSIDTAIEKVADSLGLACPVLKRQIERTGVMMP